MEDHKLRVFEGKDKVLRKTVISCSYCCYYYYYYYYYYY
jgi:hypothetical protein